MLGVNGLSLDFLAGLDPKAQKLKRTWLEATSW